MTLCTSELCRRQRQPQALPRAQLTFPPAMASEDNAVSRRTVDSGVDTHNGRLMVQENLARFGVSLP
jgi:hypothetical protein